MQLRTIARSLRALATCAALAACRTATSLAERSEILRRAVAAGQLRIVAGVHDLDTGVVRFLE